MRFGLFALVLLLTAPAFAETITPTEITGPLSFKAGETEYVLDMLYAPAGDSSLLKPYLLQQIEVSGDKRDRWSRLRVTSPLTLTLLRKGEAQLMPLDSAPTPEMLAAEHEGRNRGLWRANCCRMLVADAAEKGLNSWRIVRGTVHEVAARRDVTYINFGADWRTDFTVVIPTRLARDMALAELAGREIEVRGYISWRFGPSITLSHAAQIRLPDRAQP